MVTIVGEVEREPTVELLPKTAAMITGPDVPETTPSHWSHFRGQRSLEGILLAIVVFVVGWLLARHSGGFITLLATPTCT